MIYGYCNIEILSEVRLKIDDIFLVRCRFIYPENKLGDLAVMSIETYEKLVDKIEPYKPKNYFTAYR